MIKLQLRKERKIILSFAEGHAGYARKGTGYRVRRVSALIINTVNSLEGLQKMSFRLRRMTTVLCVSVFMIKNDSRGKTPYG